MKDMIAEFFLAFDYIHKNNKSDSNPYHNNMHNLTVFENCMKLFDIYRKEYDLKSIDLIEIGLAALFHDFNHSGGKLKDDENIKLAVIGLKKFLSEHPEFNVNEDNVINILESTEFPHKDLELNILQKIIRDADTMGGISDNWFNVVTSLSAEMGKNFIEFIPIQIKFLDMAKFNTPYCNKMLEDKRDKIKNDLMKIQSDQRLMS